MSHHICTRKDAGECEIPQKHSNFNRTGPSWNKNSNLELHVKFTHISKAGASQVGNIEICI